MKLLLDECLPLDFRHSFPARLAPALSATLWSMTILSRRRFCGSASAFLALPAFAAGDERGILVTAAQAA